jgi:hypothetical protein
MEWGALRSSISKSSKIWNKVFQGGTITLRYPGGNVRKIRSDCKWEESLLFGPVLRGVLKGTCLPCVLTLYSDGQKNCLMSLTVHPTQNQFISVSVCPSVSCYSFTFMSNLSFA